MDLVEGHYRILVNITYVWKGIFPRVVEIVEGCSPLTLANFHPGSIVKMGETVITQKEISFFVCKPAGKLVLDCASSIELMMAVLESPEI